MTSEPPRPFHRWRANEDMGFHGGRGDYCLACGVRRYPRPDDLSGAAIVVASGPCPGNREWWTSAARGPGDEQRG